MPASIGAYRRCLEIDPHYNAAHYRLGVALFHAGDSKGPRALRALHRLTPEYQRARYHIGIIHQRKGELDEAEREFRGNVAEGIGEASSLYHLAEIQRSRGDEKAAAALLDQAREFGRKASE